MSPNNLVFKRAAAGNHGRMIQWIQNSAPAFWLILWIGVLSNAIWVSRLDAAEKAVTREPWSWKPVGYPIPPEIKGALSARVKNPIDQFVLHELAKQGMTFSPEASDTVLLRRVYFTLLGLPPPPSEISRFAQEKTSDKWARLIDQLLESPAYGERWGRHWLDVVRYTESQGFEYDRLRDNAWQYRDYVINSFNADKPYNLFVQEQVAGDAIEPITRDSIIATSMLVSAPWDEAGNAQANVKQRMATREEELEDLVSVVSQTFLGATMHCARCHDHKFDPIPQEDYYAMKAVFEGVRHGDGSVVPPAEKSRIESETKKLDEQIVVLQKRLTGLQWPVFGEGLKNLNFGAISVPTELKPLYRFGYGNGFTNGTLQGKAEVREGLLIVAGDGGFFKSPPLESLIKEKTLEALVLMADLEHRGGGVISIENEGGLLFDSITFGERQPRKWSAGSNFFQRTRDLNAPEEATVFPAFVHIAAVYAADGAITLYRNGRLYGESYKTEGPVSFSEAKAHLLLGLRHTGAGNGYFRGAIAGASLYDKALTADEIARLFESIQPAVLAVKAADSVQSDAKKEVEQLQKEIAALQTKSATLKAIPVAYIGKRVQPEPTKFLKRGDINSPMGEVKPGALSKLPTYLPNFGLEANAPEAERRRALALWMASEKNPLTARVMANRVWHYHFGQGLVPTPSDFGNSGSTPSHPELLDWLARKFMEEGWSVKKLHKLILTSAAFRQDSAFNAENAAKDNGNVWLWRFTPRRLQAEEVRDSLLAISGELNKATGGPSFRPFTEVKFNSSAFFPEDKIGPEFNRRSVYRMNVNSGKDPMLDAFDCPDPSVKTPKRGVTTTPMQALGLMNNSFVQRQAAVLSAKLEKHEPDISGRIERAAELIWGRKPNASEKSAAAAFIEKRGLQAYVWALFNSTEFLYVQ